VGDKVAQTMYTHVNKCKNDTIKRGKKEKNDGWGEFLKKERNNL
jgi:hypothetical protein